MNSIGFSELEIDAIGEILNISLGASATAASTMLNARVDITTPVVRVVSWDEFEFQNLEPAVGVEITYVSGLSGKNVMLLKRLDIKVIVEMLMGIEIPDDEFELDEMNVSAICEVMNQMMGASSTALSEFLNKPVNISPPISFEIKGEQEFREKYFSGKDDPMVVVGFSLKITDQLQSEFINVMPAELAKELVAGFFQDDSLEASVDASPLKETVEEEPESGSRLLTQEEIEKMLAESTTQAEAPAPVVEPEVVAPAAETVVPNASTIAPVSEAIPPMPEMSMAAQPANSTASDNVLLNQIAMQQQMIQQMQNMMEQMQKNMGHQSQDPKEIKVHNVPQPNLTDEGKYGQEEDKNMELILGVPLDISVEIGRTKKMVKDILEFTKGSLVVLDKVAGEQVDLFVNGRCIARGDVVVVEDNFGIRITEIVKKNIIVE